METGWGERRSKAHSGRWCPAAHVAVPARGGGHGARDALTRTCRRSRRCRGRSPTCKAPDRPSWGPFPPGWSTSLPTDARRVRRRVFWSGGGGVEGGSARRARSGPNTKYFAAKTTRLNAEFVESRMLKLLFEQEALVPSSLGDVRGEGGMGRIAQGTLFLPRLQRPWMRRRMRGRPAPDRPLRSFLWASDDRGCREAFLPRRLGVAVSAAARPVRDVQGPPGVVARLPEERSGDRPHSHRRAREGCYPDPASSPGAGSRHR